jgi:hypothetical protein
MGINLALKDGRVPKCQRCGGQLVRSDSDIECLQCGAIHTTDGRLETINAMMKLMMQQPEVDRYAVGANE